MSVERRFPIVAKHSLQLCPFCNEAKPMVTLGINLDGIDGTDIKVHPDRGYSFCNCNNIWFTDWSNIDQTSFESQYVVDRHLTNSYKDKTLRVLHHYINNKIIANKGYGKNNFLDLGSLTNYLLDEVNRLGWKATGWDMYARTNFDHKLIIGDFEDQSLITLDNFDIIWANHIFEHFHYPLEALKKCYAMLNDGGKLFIAMPDPFFIDFSNTYMWGHFLLRQHYILWDKDSFCDEAEKIGFKINMAIRNTEVNAMNDMHIVMEK